MKRKLTPLELEVKALEKEINLSSIRPSVPKALEGRFGRMLEFETGKEYILPLSHWTEKKYHLIQEVDSQGAGVSGDSGVARYLEVDNQKDETLTKENEDLKNALELAEKEGLKFKDVAEKLAQENEELTKANQKLEEELKKINKK